MWLPEVRDRKRYPGVVSTGRVEVFCPDELDLLSAWAFLPVSDEEESKQARVRTFAYHEGSKTDRYCTPRTGSRRCCRCGERASVVHVAGDLKNWPAMQNLLRSYLPPWKVPPLADSLVASASRRWWGGSARTERLMQGTEDDAVIIAKDLG